MWKSQRGASTLADLLKLDNWLKFIQSSIIPGALLTHCRLCAQRTSGVDICAGCHADLPWSMHNPPPPRHVGKVWSAFDYGYPIANLIHAAKYDGEITVANLLGRLMVDGCRRQGMQPQGVVFPVPVPRPRLMVRGYNQVVEIARPLGLELGLPIDLCSVVRTGSTGPQANLDAHQRRTNVRGSFTIGRRLDGLSAIILDDVLTTGATVSAMAESLLGAGAGTVDVLVCAYAR